MIKAKVNFEFDSSNGRIEVEPPEIDEFFDAGEDPTVMLTIFDGNDNETTVSLDYENFHKLFIMFRRIDGHWNNVNYKIDDICDEITSMKKECEDDREENDCGSGLSDGQCTDCDCGKSVR